MRIYFQVWIFLITFFYNDNYFWLDRGAIFWSCRLVVGSYFVDCCIRFPFILPWAHFPIPYWICHSPIAREGTINCVDGNAVTIFSEGFVSPHVVAEEVYSTDSKCFERVGGDSLCLDAFCSREPHVLTVKAGSNIFTCNSDFQEISFTSSTGDVVEFICPRLSAVCPETFCPANCSGKGVCKFNGVAPYCECFDPNDLSDGCYDSLPKSPAKCEDDNFVHSNENASNRLIAYGAIPWSLLFGLLCHTSDSMMWCAAVKSPFRVWRKPWCSSKTGKQS